jgi:hypothetical protein
MHDQLKKFSTVCRNVGMDGFVCVCLVCNRLTQFCGRTFVVKSFDLQSADVRPTYSQLYATASV